MRKNVLRISVGLVCLSMLLLCLRLQSCSNIISGNYETVPPGYALVKINTGSERAVSNDEIGRMRYVFYFNGETNGTNSFQVKADSEVSLVVEGYVDGVLRARHVEPPFKVHEGANYRTIVMSRERDEVAAPPQMDISIEFEPGEPQPGGSENSVPVLGQYGDTIETSHFEHVKDVQWGNNTATHSLVEASGYCYGLSTTGTAADKYEQTSAALWTEGSYVHLTKNEGVTANAGSYLGNSNTGKEIPTFTETVYTKQNDGSYAPHVLARDLIILGISEKGMMTQVGGSFGGFIYTSAGWAESNNGSAQIYVDYISVYPTEEEIADAISSFRN